MHVDATVTKATVASFIVVFAEVGLVIDASGDVDVLRGLLWAVRSFLLQRLERLIGVVSDVLRLMQLISVLKFILLLECP